MSGHDDLLRKGFGHARRHEPVPEIAPSDRAPPWVNVISNQMALLIKEIREMKQSTTDLIAATNDLVSNDAAMEKAVDDLVAAQASGDDAAVETAVGQLKILKANQSSHLAALVTAIPPVVAAPTDPAPVTVGQPATASTGQ